MSTTSQLALKLSASLGILGAATALMSGPVSATHSWGGYHWARTSTPFSLVLGNNVGTAWAYYLNQASSDWSASNVLNTVVKPGGIRPKTCRPTSGMVQVCSAKYGYNGWLGVAQIWITGDHVTQGTVKLNDSYFASATYNKPEWRALVACQEIGHTFGLDHQDEDQTNTNLGTCMDYTNKPLGPPDNEKPNAHDYDELAIIYSHLDGSSTVGAALVASARPADDWGRAVRFTRQGKGRVFVRDLAPNRRVVTFVTWVPE